MRTYGRAVKYDAQGMPEYGPWQVVTTDANGFNDHVYLTALAQTLLLNLNESPFFANYGIPAKNSVLNQVFPDFNSIFTQQQYAKYFASLLISRRPGPTPVYDIQCITHAGVVLNKQIPIPI